MMRRSQQCTGPRRKMSKDEAACYAAEMALYTEEFQNMMRICKSLIKQLKRPKDVELANKLMRHVLVLSRSENLQVRKYTNEFFKFFVRVLSVNASTQPLNYYQQWYGNTKKDVNLWLQEHKSYWAMKEMSDGTMVIYMAVAKDFCAGWQDMGLRGYLQTCS